MKRISILILTTFLLVACNEKTIDSNSTFGEGLSGEIKSEIKEEKIKQVDKKKNQFKEGMKLELLEIDETEKKELSKTIEKKITKHKDDEKEILKELSNIVGDKNLRLIVKDGTIYYLCDMNHGSVYSYQKGTKKLTDLKLNIGQGDDFLGQGLVRKDDVVFFSKNKIIILEKGKTGNYASGTALNTNAKIEEIRDNAVLYTLDDMVYLFPIDEGVESFGYAGQFVGTVDQYVVIRQQNTLFFLDPENYTYSLVESPTLRRITSTYGSPVLQFQEASKEFKYYKVKESD